jgi:hypothetical protein
MERDVGASTKIETLFLALRVLFLATAGLDPDVISFLIRNLEILALFARIMDWTFSSAKLPDSDSSKVIEEVCRTWYNLTAHVAEADTTKVAQAYDACVWENIISLGDFLTFTFRQESRELFLTNAVFIWGFSGDFFFLLKNPGRYHYFTQ